MISDGNGRIILQSGAFLHEQDARRVGEHFASDPDLKVHLANR